MKIETVSVYPSAADVNRLNSAILALNNAKKAQQSSTYSENLRAASITISNLWKAENL